MASGIRKTKERAPFFIVGSGRSGSTLLSTILNASDQVFVPPESDFIARAFPYFGKRNDFSAADYRCIAAFFQLCSQQDGWGMSNKSIVRALKQAQPESFADVNTCIYNAYLRAKGLGDLRWGIKRPVLIASLDRILSVYPNALIINVLRDGRDVYVSYKEVRKEGFSWGPSGAVTTALYWVDAARRIPYGPQQNFFEIRYEDLVVDAKGAVGQICDFLGIDYKVEMIRDFAIVETTKKIISERHRDTIHGKIFSGIDAQNINRYKHSLNAMEKLAFEVLAGPYLDRHGYQYKRRHVTEVIAKLMRPSIYASSRLYNNCRYRYRDFKQYRRACRIAR